LPHDTTEEEIRKFFSQPIGTYKGEMELRKVCMGYEITSFNEVIESIK